MKNDTTLKTLAKELKLSISTVSRALSNNPRIGHKTRELVLELARKKNYVPNQASNFLKTNKTYAVAYLVPSLKEEYFSIILHAIENLLEKAGYHVYIFQSLDDMNREIAATDFFLKTRIDGVFVSLAAETNNYLHFKKLEDYGIPVIFFDRIPRNYPSHTIKCNMQQSEEDALQLFANLGLNRIGLINAPSNLEASDQRLNGFLYGLEKFNLSTKPEYIKRTNLSREDVEQKMIEILKLEVLPEGIICFNDLVSYYAMQACRKNNIMPNKDIYFIGHGNVPMNKFIQCPPYATVEQYPEKTGRLAAELFLNLTANEHEKPTYQQLVFDSDFVILQG